MAPDSSIVDVITGAVDTFKFSILLPTGLKSISRGQPEQIVITFPPEISLIDSSDEKCSALVTSSGKQLLCQTDTENNCLIVTHDNNLDLFENEVFEITLDQGAYNPQTTQRSSEFFFETKLFDEVTEQFYLVRKSSGSDTYNVKANKPNQI